MAPLRVSLRIPSPPELAWDHISLFDHWPSWGVTITAVEPPSGRVRPGIEGRVKTIAGTWLPFRITDVRDGAFWTWRVAGVAATGHLVEPDAEGCRVTFTAPWWAPFYLPVLSRALRTLSRMLAD